MLQRGQNIKLNDIVKKNDFEIEISTNMLGGVSDVACFGVDINNQLSDDRYFIFYNQTQSPENALNMSIKGNNTIFHIDLNRLPKNINKLVFTITAEEKTLHDLQQGNMNIIAENQIVENLLFYGKDFEKQKAIILCEIYRKNDFWRLSMVVNGFNGGLRVLLANFGGEEIKPNQQIQNQQEQCNNIQQQKDIPPQQTVKKISLKKSGDSHKIDLSKNIKTIHTNLNWSNQTKKGLFGITPPPIDLDLACMYRLKDGTKGVIQALGNSFGSEKYAPYIKLDMDDRTGSSATGENMYFYKPELIEFAVIFAYIYDGVADWNKTDATITLKQPGSPDIELNINNANTNKRFVVFASMTASANGLNIVREERFFKGHKEIDKHYGFGFIWVPGSK